MTRFRFVRCPVCHSSGFTVSKVGHYVVPTGCRSCGGNELEFGSGRIGVTFERNPRVDDALRAHSGKEQ